MKAHFFRGYFFGESAFFGGVWSAFIWKNAPNIKSNAVVFVWKSFFLEFFRASLDKNSLHPQKFACSYTYDHNEYLIHKKRKFSSTTLVSSGRVGGCLSK